MSIGAPNLASTVARFASPHTRRRFSTPAKNADGYLVDTYTDATISAYVHDAPADVVAARPEGLEGTRTIMGYTTGDVRLGSPDTQGRPDSIVYLGEEFRVYKLTKWGAGSTGAIAWQVFEAAGPVSR